jgi:hypothetical protein
MPDFRGGVGKGRFVLSPRDIRAAAAPGPVAPRAARVLESPTRVWGKATRLAGDGAAAGATEGVASG